MRNFSSSFVTKSSSFKFSFLTLSILTATACGAGGGGSFEADVHYQNDKNTPINEQKKQQNNHHKNNNDDENEELQTGYAVEIPIRNFGQTDKPSGDPVIKAILGDYDNVEHYAPIGNITPFTNSNLAEHAFETQLFEEGNNGDKSTAYYSLNSEKLAFVLNETFGIDNPYDNGSFPQHIPFFNNIDLGYATIVARYKDQPKSLKENRSGVGGFIYYRGVNPSQALPTKDQDLEYQGVWAYTTDADINRYKDSAHSPEEVNTNIQNISAGGFNGGNLDGQHGIQRGGTSFVEPYTLGHIAKFNINFGRKSFKGNLSVVKGSLNGGEYQYKDKTGLHYLVDTHPEMSKEERRKAATIKRFELEGEIKGNTFAGNAKGVKNNDAFDNYFHDSQDMKGSFFGDNAEELAGKFTNQNANGDNSLFVVFGGKRSPESKKLVQGTDGANKDQEKIMDAFVIGYDLPDSNNPTEVAYIRNNLDNFGNKEVLHINGQTINLFEDREIVREDNRYDLDNLIIGRYIAKGGSSIREQLKNNPAFEQAQELQQFWNENIQSHDDEEEESTNLASLSKEEVLNTLEKKKEDINLTIEQNEAKVASVMETLNMIDIIMGSMEDPDYMPETEEEMAAMELMENEEKLNELLLSIDTIPQENETLQTKLATLEEKQKFIENLDFDNVIKPALNNWISEESLSDKDKALIQRTITNNFNGGAYFLQGNSTPLKDMPASGTANYQGKWFGRIEKDGRYASPNQTAANINVDFGNKKLTGELTGDHSRKVFDIRADIHGNQFKGTANTPSEGFNIADSSNSSHSQPIYVHMKDAKVQGGFFGPKAQDLGGSVLYNDAETKTKAVAVFGATKQ